METQELENIRVFHKFLGKKVVDIINSSNEVK